MRNPPLTARRPAAVATNGRRWAFVAIAIAVLSAALAPVASAATHVSVSGSTLEVTGGTLEHQNTAITGPDFPVPLAGGFNPPTAPQGFYDVRETESGGPHENPGAGCTSVSAREVHCTASGITELDVDAGSLADTLAIYGGVPVSVDATGGSGDDIMRGGPETDVFRTGSIDGADQYYGGGGKDGVFYEARSVGVTVSLDGHSNDGASGENDFVSGDIENIRATNLRDTLIGNDQNNQLFGLAGNDDITGGGGSDELIGDGGDDTLRDDLDATADTFACNKGTDQVFLDLKGVLPGGADCEKVVQSAIDQHPNVAIKVHSALRIDRFGRVHIKLACPRKQRHGCKHGRLTLKRGKHKLGSRRYSLRRGKHKTIVLRLSRREAARVRHSHRGVKVRATAREKDPKGRPKLTIALFRLKAKH
jgi:hypothetical protein